MVANSNLTLTALDFDTLKSNLITFLQSQSQFKDYNFSGSNINVLLDILSYNSYLNSFYLNMVASEMFLDSAQLLNSVVSHAKELNYVPRSATSSAANLNFTISTNGISNPFIIPAGTTFTGLNSNGTYIFTTPSATYYNSSNTTYTVNNLIVYEGNYITDSFIMDYTVQNQQFILSNPNIDLSTLTVTCYENSNTGTIYSKASSIYNITSNSTIYFVQAAQDQQYEILFGDNILGHTPLNNSLITVNYRVASGNTSDGVSAFTLTYNLGNYNNGIAAVNGSIVCLANSSGGANQESIASIKFNGPRYFAAQQRAIASNDYSALILSNFNGSIAGVAVYGGEQLTPKQYGYVAICLKPYNATITPTYIKNQINNFLQQYISIPAKIIITDPDYYYIGINCNVSYSAAQTTLSSTTLQNEVLNTITTFNTTNLGAFNSSFRYSKFVASIDNTDTSILSNDTTTNIIKRITPISNTVTSYVINYNNPAATVIATSTDIPNFYSSAFTYIDNYGNQYTNSIIRDDNYGGLIVYNTINNIVNIINSNIGTINYTTGQVQINNLNVASYSGSYISLYMNTQVDDIIVSKNQILLISPNDVSITITSS